ncbi:MAG TPA: thiamine phosphate synthase [Candidatus Acidoferrales bacterium]|nr:thiamine phosphate synthase [Candidatus Acidoferrales bacterium]
MILCYVTDRHLLRQSADNSALRDELLRHIERTAAAGVDWIQIREKDLHARELVELTRGAVAAAKHAGLNVTKAKEKSGAQGGVTTRAAARVIVNDRVDVALAGGAAGVHLGATSAPATEVIRWLRAGNAPADFMAGVSCHELSEAIAAENAGANYIFFGPIFETPSKKAFGPPQGTMRLAEICSRVHIPVLGIGGITQGNASSCLRAGAAGIAAIRMFQETQASSDLAETVSRLRGSAASASATNP